MGVLIGIDFGTASCRAAAFLSGKPVLIPNREGDYETPSVIAFPEQGVSVAGKEALRIAQRDPQQAVFSCKEYLGTDDIYTDVWGVRHTPEELAGTILLKIRRDAECFLGEKVEGAVLCVPASFNIKQAKALRAAAYIAGIGKRRVIHETSAAALAFYYVNDRYPESMLLLDIGCGYLDVSACISDHGVVQIFYANGIPLSGTSEMEAAEVIKRMGEEAADTIKADPQSSGIFSCVRVRGGNGSREVLMNAVRAAAGHMPVEEGRADDVALGAAVQAGIITGDAGCRDMLLLEVLSHGIYIQLADQVVEPVIERNAAIPTKGKMLLETTRSNQEGIHFHLVEGSAAQGTDQLALGAFGMEGLPAGEKGKVRVQLEIDAGTDVESILDISVRENTTGKHKKFRGGADFGKPLMQLDAIGRVVHRRLRQEETRPAEQVSGKAGHFKSGE